MLADYVAAVRADSPTSFWEMQEGAGDLVDAMLLHDGTPANITYAQAGPADALAIACGSTTSVRVTSDVAYSNNTFTLETWAMMHQVATGSRFIAYRSSEFYCYQNSNSKMFTFAVNNNTGATRCSVTATPFTDFDVWHHLVFTFDGATNTGTFYCDGAQAGTNTGVNSGVAVTANSLFVGTSWRGSLCAMAYYDHVLSSSAINAHLAAMTSLPPGPPSNGPSLGFIPA